MKNRGGAATTIVLLAAAIFGVSYIPRKSVEPSTTEETQKPAARPVVATTKNQEVKNPGQQPIVSCEQIAQRLQRFYQDRAHVRLPGACFSPIALAAQGPEPPSNPSLNFAIALVADPVQTHLPLLFDRSIEAIQQAAQDLNYSYDGSWFPWNQTEKNFDTSAQVEQAAALAAELQEQPGVMVFRSGITDKGGKSPYDSGLVVFVVAEQPTGGIRDTQFEHALQWIEALQLAPSGQPLLILGPSFSGSLPSLRRELTPDLLPRYPAGIRIYSGSVSSDASVNWFKDFLSSFAQAPSSQEKPRLEFRTFYESDLLMTDRFLCYLQHEGYDLDHVAILSEDQTAFGVNPSKARVRRCQDESEADRAHEPKYFYYPRDIATLRSAYEKQSIFSAGKQQASVPSSGLREDLSEPASSQHDTVRTYAGQLTPLAQESVLFGITNVLESKNIEFVILRGSNTLDQLFLSEFLRRSYPNGRVVIDGSDLLFRRGMQGASLRGVMLLSPYPLLSWTQDAIPPIHGRQQGSYRLFPQDLTEGTYIAARELFETLSAASANDVAPIRDYGVPRAAQSGIDYDEDDMRPATWVSVVGHRQFWSIAILNDHTEKGAEGDKVNYGPNDKSLLTAESPLRPGNRRSGDATGTKARRFYESLKAWRERSGTVLPGEMTGLLFFCVAFSLWNLYCCANGSIIRPPRARAYFAPIPKIQHTLLIFLGTLMLGFLSVTIALTMVLGVQVLLARWACWSAVGLTLMVLSGFLGCWLNYQLPVVRGWRAAAETKIIERWRRRWHRQRWEWFVTGFKQRAHFVVLKLRRVKVPRRTRSDNSNKIRLMLQIYRCRNLCKWGWLPTLAVVSMLRYLWLSQHLTIANSIPTYWRNVYLRSGVSGLLPQVVLLVGIYAWFWFNLHGLSLFGDDRPKLPRVEDLPAVNLPLATGVGTPGQEQRQLRIFRVFSQQGAAENIERNALPLSPQYGKMVVAFFVLAIVVLWIALGERDLRSLGDRRFGSLIFYGVSLCIALILADAWQLLATWSQLRQLLVFLDRLRLRRTLGALRGFAGKSVWKMSGNVLEERYRLISRQLESFRNLQNTLRAWAADKEGEAAIRNAAIDHLTQFETQSMQFVEWYVDLLNDEIKDRSKLYDIRRLQDFQEELAATAGYVMSQVVVPAWRNETQSLIIDQGASAKSDAGSDCPPVAKEDYLRAAEEFFVLPYLGFIQNTMGRVRTMAFSILSLFVAATLGVSCYPFDPLPAIGAIFLILFLMVGVTMVFVYAEMSRDSTLSHITNTNPGELGMEFWIKIFTFGLGPLIGLLTTLFPSMTDFVVSFLQPGAQAFK